MRVVAGGADGTVHVWEEAAQPADLTSSAGQQQQRQRPVSLTAVDALIGHAAAVWAIAARPPVGGVEVFASGGDDKTVRLWQVKRHCRLPRASTAFYRVFLQPFASCFHCLCLIFPLSLPYISTAFAAEELPLSCVSTAPFMA